MVVHGWGGGGGGDVGVDGHGDTGIVEVRFLLG